MKTEKFDNKNIRRILTGMITDDSVCAHVSSQWTPEGLFDSDWCNLVGGWCVRYHRKYSKAPGENIASIFDSWAAKPNVQESTIETIEGFLRSLSAEYLDRTAEPSDYILDLAGEYFNKVRIEREIEIAKIELQSGKVERAQERLRNCKRVELGKDSYIQPLVDYSIWEESFDGERRNPLVTYPGPAGKWLGDVFVRGEFYAFLACEKCGKTTFLIDFVYRSILRRNRVAYFDTGDSSEEEAIIRLACRATERAEWSGFYDFPIDLSDDMEVIKETKELDAVDALDSFRQLRKAARFPEAFRIVAYPNSTASIDTIDNTLDSWEKDGWRPDVVVIDYADILAPPSNVVDPLEQIDETWARMRRMSQARHCLVLTATQAKATAYGHKGLLGRQHFSGRKTKLAHVNGMIGINVTEEEREIQAARLNWVVRRKERDRRTKRWVNIAGCYDVHNPLMFSWR